MATKQDLDNWVSDALTELGGQGHLIAVAKVIWKNHEQDLRNSNNLFYTWQYDMRWSAQRLRAAGILKAAAISPNGIWQLNR